MSLPRLPLLVTVSLVLLVVSVSACQQGLPYNEPDTAATMGYSAGVTWGRNTLPSAPIFWLTPDQASPCYRDRLIFKHYVQPEDFAKGSATERVEGAQAYNWGFYRGFLKGTGSEPPSSGEVPCP